MVAQGVAPHRNRCAGTRRARQRPDGHGPTTAGAGSIGDRGRGRGIGLARVNQDVKQGDPLVYVQSTTENRPVLAAVAPVDGRVLRVTVRPDSSEAH